MPSKDQIDAYIASVEDYVHQSYEFVTNVDAMNDSVQRLWMHITRFGPPELPDLRLPSLGRFEVPAPVVPPPPPPPAPWYENAADWASRNKVLTGAMCATAVGAGLLVGYGVSRRNHGKARRLHAVKTVGNSTTTRRLLVVVLGGDSPLGPALINGLEKEGYIVITSVSDPDSVAKVEADGNGFVRALVFDPNEPATLQPFLRSLKATLGLRFPLHSAGDPYQSSSVSFPIMHSVVSLLTLPNPTLSPTPMPFEHLSLTSTYENYLSQSHVMPLQAIQALLPLFRMDSVRTQDFVGFAGGRRNVVFCVPAADARVGIPYAAAQSMSAAATVRGADILRRELKQIDDPQMRGIQVIVADVGVVGSFDPLGVASRGIEQSLYSSIESWTPSEQKIYASAYAAFVHTVTHGTARRPVKIDAFVRRMIEAVGRLSAPSGKHPIIVGLKLWATSFRWTFFGTRFAVGSGAHTYTFASYLPTFLLDIALNLPAIMISLRNKYLPVDPFVAPEIIRESQDAITGSAMVEMKEGDDETTDMPVGNDSAAPFVTSEPHLSASASPASSSPSEHSQPARTVESSWISVQDSH